MRQKHLAHSELKARHFLSELVHPLGESHKLQFQRAYQELKTEWRESGQSRTFPFIPFLAEQIDNWLENGQNSLKIIQSYYQEFELEKNNMLGFKTEEGVCFGNCVVDAIDHLKGAHEKDFKQNRILHPDFVDKNFYTYRDIQRTYSEYHHQYYKKVEKGKRKKEIGGCF
ncbi:MAG: hypothetical protein GY874_08685 [Desulfobacteraceae bacterium]|nr:hypothetical protein [Desulfobacteraceae bacterium]